MGMKTRKPTKRATRKPKQAELPEEPRVYSVLSLHTCECIDAYAGGIRELLTQYKVPKDQWNNIWDGVEDWPKADADHDLHWFIGFFNGLAEGQACNLEDLVVL